MFSVLVLTIPVIKIMTVHVCGSNIWTEGSHLFTRMQRGEGGGGGGGRCEGTFLLSTNVLVFVKNIDFLEI